MTEDLKNKILQARGYIDKLLIDLEELEELGDLDECIDISAGYLAREILGFIIEKKDKL